ncbi:MAG: SMC family ATPase [Bacteriovoracaceae bacterium]|nr:SMC family ATPase [Bacteriovoracaceae bacterium]
MKIHKIKINNIASLKGDHTIDFDEFQMDHGSFAITGDTGAGKSTILNSIALALYGLNYKKSLTQADFITLGEAQGKIELEFSCSGRRFLSIWDCRVRKKNGEFLKQPKISKEFYQLGKAEKEILDITPEDVIHLSFDQFCKTIILNQGQFAKFLTSGFKDRKDILEKLYHGEKLQGLNPLLRTKINEYVGQTSKIEAEISGLGQGLLEDVSSEGLKELEKELTSAQRGFSFIENLVTHLKDINHLNQKIDESKTRLTELEQRAQEQIKELNEKAKAQKEFNLKRQQFLERQKTLAPALHQALERQKNLEQLKSKITQEKQSLTQIQSQVQKTQEESKRSESLLSQLQEKLNNLKTNPLYKELNLEQMQLFKEKYHHWIKASSELNSAKKLAGHHEVALKEIDKEISQLRQLLTQTRSELGELKNLSNDNEDSTLEKTQNQLMRTIARFDSFQRERSSLLKEIDFNNEGLKKNADEISRLESKNKEVQERLQIQKDALKATKLEGAKILCIEESIENNSCVVCASDNIQHLDLSSLQDGQQKIHQYEKNLEDIESEKVELFQTIERTRTSQKAFQASNAQIKERLKSLSGQFFSSNYEVLTSLKIDEPELEKDTTGPLLKQKAQEIDSQLNESKKRQSRLQILLEKEKSIIAQGEQLRTKQTRMSTEAQQAQQRLEATQLDVEGVEQKLFELAGLGEASNFPDFLNLQESLYKTNNEISSVLQQKKHTQEKLQDLNERLSKNTKTISEMEKESIALHNQIKDLCPDMDPAKALEDLDKEADILEFQKRKIENEIKELEIEKSGLYSRRQTFSEQLKEQQALLLIHWQQLEKHLQTQIVLENDELQGLLKEISTQDIPCSSDVLELTTELSLAQLNVSKDALNLSKEKLTEYKTLLSRQKLANDKIAQLKEQLAKTTALKSQWEELYQLIGKDEFRNYILAMVEKVLIQQTNIELGKLCDGRYLIQHKQSSTKLSPDFYIIDKFRGEETRKVSTLSGGETFMVSLAMALALAELTRGNADLDSFFIDEGFGTLDHESLEDALSMLQDIETRGKQIGLISHVKELTQRIPVNIHLQKNQLGNSKIDIVYN